MSNVQDKARQTSRLYYNRGLDCARVRDMSGAVEKLRLSLQFDKTNIAARNLLGLVYFELGEVVAALSEWVISQNLQPVSNIATEYLTKVQEDGPKLRQFNQTIRQYNEALRQCKEGHDDIAAITLRKAINHNPKYVKAILLLSLIEIHAGRLSQAKKLLTKAAGIDRANPMVLRYLKEIEEQNGALAAERKGRGRKGRALSGLEPDLDQEPVASHGKYRDRPAYLNLFNVLFGLGIGILALFFMVVPAVRKSVSRDANEKIVEYTTTMATQESKINELKSKIDQSNSTVADAQQQIQNSENTAETYNNLIKAYTYYQNLDYESAQEAISKVDAAVLSTEAKELYDSIKDTISSMSYGIYLNAGNEAFYEEDWKRAAENLEKAVAISEDDYDAYTLLAQAYENMGDTAKAIETYQRIIDLYPDTRRSEYAEALMEQLGGTPKPSAARSSDTEDSENSENTVDTDDFDAGAVSAGENTDASAYDETAGDLQLTETDAE